MNSTAFLICGWKIGLPDLNKTSISIAPTTSIIQKRYYDLPGTIELMRRLAREAVVDGVEFQNLAEWERENPPRDERERRLAAWQASPKYNVDEIAALLQDAALPILSVHANRDVGICLCAGDEDEINAGKRLMHESLYLAEKVGASVCVFHLWDTWKEAFDPGFLQDVLREVAAGYPGVRASVENVPTQLPGMTPLELVRPCEWITLDLRWAALYDELEGFESVKTQIANVHLRGRLAGGEWVLDDAPFGFYEALDTIKNVWGYSGLLTLEPSGGLRDGSWQGLVAAMSSISPPPPTPPAASSPPSAHPTASAMCPESAHKPPTPPSACPRSNPPAPAAGADQPPASPEST